MAKNKTKQFNIRIDEALYNKIKEEADKEKISMTEYVINSLSDASNRINNSYTDDYIEALQQQIEQQQSAIQNKQDTIQELTRLLDQQQQLTLATQQDKEQLRIELNEKDDDDKWWKIWK